MVMAAYAFGGLFVPFLAVSQAPIHADCRVFVEDEPMVRGEAGEDADMSAELVVVLNKERVVALFDNDDIIAPEIEGYC
ncbi:hypothetical protein V6N12_074594 [Hibiscus sabdariffa]|uniref:Uncharacterized protein n=1 Tax=Hibiscus sabdariffa TaxID=183260 RepID=A0ABR2BXQ3_9ROSI